MNSLFLIVVIFALAIALSNSAKLSTPSIIKADAKEKKDKVSFKLGFPLSRGFGLALSGEGVRSKGPIKVYTAALYFDKNAVISAIKKIASLKGKSASELASSRQFEDAIINGNFAKHVVLKMSRNVSGKTMAEAIGDSVKPRMQGKDSKQLLDFQNILLSSLKDGAKTGMILSFEGTSSLTVKIDGNKKGEVRSPTLCKAFLDVYCGKDAVSPSLKSSLASVVSSWL